MTGRHRTPVPAPDEPPGNTAGGWSGNCPQCGTWLQGRDETILDVHRQVVHPQEENR